MRKKSALFLFLLLTACQGAHQVPRRPVLAVVEENYYHKYGDPVAPAEWRDRGNHGKRILTLTNGVTVAQNFNFGVLDGEVTYSYPYSSVVEKKEMYKEGQLLSTEWLSEANHPLKREENLSSGEKKVTEWYPSMAPRLAETYSRDRLMTGDYFTPEQEKKAGVVQGNGERLRFNAQGILIYKDKVASGIVVESVEFWENGAPKEITPYNEVGQIHGQKRTFLKGGEPERSEEWRNGSLHGLTIVYRGGEKVSEIPYVNGKKSGVERRHLDGGRIVEEITWLNDAQITIPKRFNVE